jgi:1-acyl-sn-glycerol-3-phosphate acyltransferase
MLFRPYIERLTARSFRSLRLIGEPYPASPRLPVLLVGNHSTWWDGFFVYLLNLRLFRRTLFVMMLEEQLQRFPFFGLVGAFGIRRGHPRSVVESLAYSASLLSDPAAMLCMFPQGELTPDGKRPLGFQRGIERIVRMHGGPVTLLPVAMRCEFLGEKLPEVFFLLDRGREVTAGDFPGVKQLERDQEALMDRLDAAIISGETGQVLTGRAS